MMKRIVENENSKQEAKILSNDCLNPEMENENSRWNATKWFYWSWS
jgi:hypothetical protein